MLACRERPLAILSQIIGLNHDTKLQRRSLIANYQGSAGALYLQSIESTRERIQSQKEHTEEESSIDAQSLKYEETEAM